MTRRDEARDDATMVRATCRYCECKVPGQRNPRRVCAECKEALSGFDRADDRAACAAYYARNRVAILAKRRAKREASLKTNLATTNCL